MQLLLVGQYRHEARRLPTHHFALENKAYALVEPACRRHALTQCHQPRPLCTLAKGLGLRVEELGFRVYSLQVRVYGSELKV